MAVGVFQPGLEKIHHMQHISEQIVTVTFGTKYFCPKLDNPWCVYVFFFSGILRIHPAFRILALSEPPVVGSSSQQWLTSELLTMFLYHHMRPLSQVEENQVLRKLVRIQYAIVSHTSLVWRSFMIELQWYLWDSVLIFKTIFATDNKTNIHLPIMIPIDVSFFRCQIWKKWNLWWI